jgi:hypothetical protein
LFAHVGVDAEFAAVILAIVGLVKYAIDNKDRWRRLMFLVILALFAAVGWWLLGRGGLLVLLHGFGPAPTTLPGSPAPQPAAVCSGSGLRLPGTSGSQPGWRPD